MKWVCYMVFRIIRDISITTRRTNSKRRICSCLKSMLFTPNNAINITGMYTNVNNYSVIKKSVIFYRQYPYYVNCG